MECLRFAEDEFVSQPVGYVVFVSSADVDPLGHLERLSRSKSLPSMFQNGVYDSNLFRMYVLVQFLSSLAFFSNRSSQ